MPSKLPRLSTAEAGGGIRGGKDEQNMLELSNAVTNSRDKNVEEQKRKKAKLSKKLKEQEGLVNANKQVMVRDRRRPRKSIKEMSVLNKRRRVIKNTARKEIQQQRNTLESMRHIELKKFSLEARELGHFVERVQKVKENRRLTMLFSKFKFLQEDDQDSSNTPANQIVGAVRRLTTQQSNRPTRSNTHGEKEELETPTRGGKQDCNTTATDPATGEKTEEKNNRKGKKKPENGQTESMVDLLDELNQMSELIKNNSTWEKILQSTGDMPKPLTPVRASSPTRSSNFTRKPPSALEAPAELQTSDRFPEDTPSTGKAKDDSAVNSRYEMRRCVSSELTPSSNKVEYNRMRSSDPVSMPPLKSYRSRRMTSEVRDEPVPLVDYNSWREREKRGEALYSPVALSPVQSGLFSPDLLVEEDEKTASYRKKMNPANSKYQMKGLSGGGDMEFKQIMGRIAPDNGPKKVGYSGQHSIIEMQVEAKQKRISDKIDKVRPAEKSKVPKTPNSKMAELIHQGGDSTKFLEEVRLIRTFASMCNCKYLRNDPEEIDQRRQQYIDDLVDNVSKRIVIRKRWRLPMMKMKSDAGIALPIISQSRVE